MGLFDDMLINPVQTDKEKLIDKHYREKSRAKKNLGSEDRIRTPQEIREERYRKKKNEWAKMAYLKLKDNDIALQQEVIDELMETPPAILSPYQEDLEYVKKWSADCTGYEGKIGRHPWWRTSLVRINNENRHLMTFHYPIKLISFQSISRFYNTAMNIQDKVLAFLEGRWDEIRENFSVTQGEPTFWKKGTVKINAIPGTYLDGLLKEWLAQGVYNGASVQFYWICNLIKKGKFIPGVLHSPHSCYLVGDTLYDGFGHCWYASLQGNGWNELLQKRELAHNIARAARDFALDKSKRYALPILSQIGCYYTRVPKNSVPYNEGNTQKWNLGEYDYYLCPPLDEYYKYDTTMNAIHLRYPWFNELDWKEFYHFPVEPKPIKYEVYRTMINAEIWSNENETHRQIKDWINDDNIYYSFCKGWRKKYMMKDNFK